MTGDTFDPFALPSAFDPLGSESSEPTSQLSRRRRSQSAADPRPVDVPAPAATVGAGGRLAHLLTPPLPPEAEPVGDAPTRLTALEAQVAGLCARLDDLQAVLDHKVADHHGRRVRAVANTVEQWCPRR